MFRIATLFAILALPVTAQAMTKAEAKEIYSRAEAHRIGEMADYDLDLAFTLMQQLAEAGDLRGTERLGTYYAKGFGTEVSLELAEDAYLTAIDGGRGNARLSYAKFLISAKRFDEAETQFQTAISEQVKGAEMRHMLVHALGQMGPATRPEIAQQWPQYLDDPQALIAAVRYHQNSKDVGIDAATHLDAILQIHRTPDDRQTGKAAEAALIYLAQTNPSAQVDLQRELLQNPKLRTKIRIEHALRLAAQTEPKRFWLAAEDIVTDAPAPLFSRALALTAKRSRNGAIRIIQLELAERGYAPGRASGMLTGATIGAMNKFCRDNGIWDTCRLGPAKGATIKAIGGAMGAKG